MPGKLVIDFSDIDLGPDGEHPYGDYRDKLVYTELQPHQRKFWDVVENLLKMGVTPTPRVVNEALGKHKRTSWNGPLCRIRAQLMDEYGYELVQVGNGFRRDTWRWRKKVVNDADRSGSD